MKNKSLASGINGLILIATFCCITGALTSQASFAKTLQGSRFNETPDPYFNPPSQPKKKTLAQTPASNPGTAGTNWTQPSAGFEAKKVPQETSAPDLWLAPLTPVRTSGGTTKSSIVSPKTPDRSNSIIRENRSFGSPNDFALKPIDTENSFQKPGTSAGSNFASQPSDSNDFQARVSPKPGQIMPLLSDPGSSGLGLLAANPDFKSSPSKDSGNGFGGSLSSGIASPDSSIAAGPNDSVKGFGPIPAAKTDAADQSKVFEPSKVIALVGGEPIFVGDLLFDINQLIEQFMPQAPEEVKEQERQKMIPRMLPKFVEQKMLFMGSVRKLPEGADIEAVLEQAGKEFDDKAMDKMIENSGLKSVSELDAHLRIQGSSLRKLRRSWSIDQLTKYFLSQQLKVATEVTHQEMLDSYREDHESYAVPARSRWEQVMIRFDRSPSRTEAKQVAAELNKQIVYGANLAAVAKKSSHGFRADEGGQHDWTSRGALVLKELDEAIFTLPVGKLSDVIETRDGFHVVRVIERTEATHKPFLEAQVKIKERIQNEKRNEAFKEHVAKLKDEIPVEYFLNEDVAEPQTDSKLPRTALR